jgi:RNA polymerase sigma-70 factor (ECF subfamily)
MAEAPDEELMLAYGGGDAGAFDILYARHRARLFRFILRSIKVRASAEELYQEVWVRVIEARASYKPTARFTTWLYTIAHNRLVDHWRRRGLDVEALDDQDPPGEAPDPVQELEGRRALERFKAALDKLPAVQREAFLLHEEGGLTVREIAAATGSIEEAAKSRLRYALAKLKEAIEGG